MSSFFAFAYVRVSLGVKTNSLLVFGVFLFLACILQVAFFMPHNYIHIHNLPIQRCSVVDVEVVPMKALSERSAMSVRYDVRAWFEAAVRKNPDNTLGVIRWGNALAKAANAYIRTGDPDQFIDMHLALMSPIPKE